MISNNQGPQNSRALPPLDSLFTTNAPPEADPRKLNGVTDNGVTDNPRSYTTSDTNLAQISALADHDEPFLRRCDTLQPGPSTNLAGLRILVDADTNADLMRRPETVSWDISHTGDAHAPAIVPTDATVRTVLETNHDVGIAYGRQAREHDTGYVIPSTIHDPGNALAGTVERAVAMSRDMKPMTDNATQQSNDSRPLRCYGRASHNTPSSRLPYEGRSKLIEVG